VKVLEAGGKPEKAKADEVHGGKKREILGGDDRPKKTSQESGGDSGSKNGKKNRKDWGGSGQTKICTEKERVA